MLTILLVTGMFAIIKITYMLGYNKHYDETKKDIDYILKCEYNLDDHTVRKLKSMKGEIHES